jgi:transcriptional regulator with XRE-family HTH domain
LRSIEEIIKFLLDKYNLKTESELAKLLCVEANTLSGWKKRGKIPFENLLKIVDEKNSSLDEILGVTNKSLAKSEIEKELLVNFKKLPKEKQEIYLLRIKADAIELGLG